MFSFGHCPNCLSPIRATCTTFLNVKNNVLARITEQRKDDYDNDVSDNCGSLRNDLRLPSKVAPTTLAEWKSGSGSHKAGADGCFLALNGPREPMTWAMLLVRANFSFQSRRNSVLSQNFWPKLGFFCGSNGVGNLLHGIGNMFAGIENLFSGSENLFPGTENHFPGSFFKVFNFCSALSPLYPLAHPPAFGACLWTTPFRPWM